MVSITLQPGVESAMNIMNILIKAVDEVTKEAYQICWEFLMSLLTKHWVVVIIFLSATLMIALIKAIMGRWGTLGHVLYNYFYFGTLFIIGLLLGPDVFASSFLSIACVAILYPLCYFIVGIILKETGFRR